jgi:hypothetical protein
MLTDNEQNDFALVLKAPTAIEKAAPRAKRIISGMVVDVIALANKGLSPRIVIMDENPYPVELMQLAIKKWFRNAVLNIFQDRDNALQELPLLKPHLLIVEIVNAGKVDLRPFEDLVKRKVTYPVLAICGLDVEINAETIVKAYSSKGLKIVFLKKPFTTESFFRILETNLKILRDTK